ncbi:DUF2306 domain-containing protein [Paenibacillus paridis]|uniref:DUF2306 domain-containing protein n=1 Tax=Paenibacillus paridis TaxID=2583376 RepID=UPI001EE471AB|nr:DUF2306 domain-containing protein [Paenibacillus paridis]
MDRLNHQKVLFNILSVVSILIIFYALAKNFMIDPEAEGFLSYKTGLKRELNLPVWLNVMYVHVGFACLAMASGLLNFSTINVQNSRKLHRINGYVYVVSVLLVVLTSGYMAPYATGGKVSSMGFNLLNIIWPMITMMALVQIRKKRMISHWNWMIRSYAFCFTNMLIHMITFISERIFGLGYADSYTIGIYAALALLLLIPEVVIRTIHKS